MPSKEKVDGKCNAKVRNTPEEWDDDTTGYCMNPPGFRCEGDGGGRCYLHGGRVSDANKGNDHAKSKETHGLYADRQLYYEKRSPRQQRWIDAVVESILSDMPEEDPSFAKIQMVRNIAIDMHKMKNANEYIDEVGVVHRDKTVGYTDDGKPIKVDEENTINLAYDRLQKTITRQLEKLGVMDSPESEKADAQADIAVELAKMREERESNEE